MLILLIVEALVELCEVEGRSRVDVDLVGEQAAFIGVEEPGCRRAKVTQGLDVFEGSHERVLCEEVRREVLVVGKDEEAFHRARELAAGHYVD